MYITHPKACCTPTVTTIEQYSPSSYSKLRQNLYNVYNEIVFLIPLSFYRPLFLNHPIFIEMEETHNHFSKKKMEFIDYITSSWSAAMRVAYVTDKQTNAVNTTRINQRTTL